MPDFVLLGYHKLGCNYQLKLRFYLVNSYMWELSRVFNIFLFYVEYFHCFVYGMVVVHSRGEYVGSLICFCDIHNKCTLQWYLLIKVLVNVIFAPKLQCKFYIVFEV